MSKDRSPAAPVPDDAPPGASIPAELSDEDEEPAPGPPVVDVGREAVEEVSRQAAGLWRTGAARAGEHIQRLGADHLAAQLRERDPDLLSRLAEVGVVRQAWIDDPTDGPAVQAAHPLDVLQRAVEARAERRPAPLSRLGLTAVRLLSDLGGNAAPAGAEEVTLCFTDLVGFTKYTALEGDERARALLEEHYRAAGRIVRSRNGHTVKRIGDGLLLRFTDPVDAVRAALDIVDAAPAPLKVRAGLHRGTSIVERGDVFGHTVNVAARVADATAGGEVIVTAAVKKGAADASGLTFGRLRRHHYKGVAEDISICRVTRVPPKNPDR